ncbi:hypothetical protein V8E36_005121, partial [Tilletia maclaganii]
GESGCNSYRECDSGLCISGTCQLGSDGNRYITSAQCEDLCSTEGVCYTLSPRGEQSTKDVCHYDSDCISGKCSADYSIGVTRPALDNVTSDMVTSYDQDCSPSGLDGRCGADSDCSQGVCSASTKTCTLVPRGGTCISSAQCSSGYCDDHSPSESSTSGTCVLQPSFGDCSADSDCFSNSCEPEPCFSRGCYYGGSGKTVCEAVPAGARCRFDDDCDVAFSDARCGANKICGNPTGGFCSKDSQCLSNRCESSHCA